MQAIRVHAPGGAEVLALDEIPAPVPQAGEVVLRVEAIGVNFIEVYQRAGLYPVERPWIPGGEAAGTVEAVGAGVVGLAPGDRVASTYVLGAYAERARVAADKLVRVPDDVTTRQAAAVLLQGMTAQYLTRATFPLGPGHVALVHAAAGGVGLLLCQMARRLGARVLATVSTSEKAALARGAGADETILYTEQDFESETRRLTGGAGVDVVYDSVGKTTFEKSLRCLRPRGTMVLFGQSSGPVPPFDPQVLNRGGSLFLTRPKLQDYTATRAELDARASDVLGAVAGGELTVRVHREFPLADAAAAHRALESRGTVGKLLLIP